MSIQPEPHFEIQPSAASPAEPRVSARRAMLARFFHNLSTFLVFATLGSLLYWGHHTGWTMPKFSSLAAHAESEEDGWCSEHNVPESQCVECNADLLPKPKCLGWCSVHKVHDCPICHPEVAQLRGKPQFIAASFSRVKPADADQWPENNSKCMLHERRIQFVSREAVDKAGIVVETVGVAPVAESVKGSGEVGYDQNRIARLSSRAHGSMFRVLKQAGDAVRAGDVLALVDAAEVGRAKSELQQALVVWRQKSKVLNVLAPLESRGEIPPIQVRETEAAVSEARIRLVASQQALNNFGLPLQIEALENLSEAQVAERLRFLGIPEFPAQVQSGAITGNLLPIRAPLDGVVISRDVVSGEVVDASKTLFVVADTRAMWLTLDVRLEDAKRIALGQEVRFLPDGCRQASGRVTWISTEADSKTRTVKIRAALDNSDGRLRANVFGTGKVIFDETAQTVVVSNCAVQWEGCCHVVFVRDKDFLEDGTPKLFHVRTVQLGAQDEKNTEIVAGLLPGEIVATAGSSLLRAELLKGDLGEGCACCKK